MRRLWLTSTSEHLDPTRPKKPVRSSVLECVLKQQRPPGPGRKGGNHGHQAPRTLLAANMESPVKHWTTRSAICGAGIKQSTARTVTCGASDMPLQPAELDKIGVIQFPTVMGGIVPVVNLDGIKSGDLTIDGPTLAKIYLGEIKT